MLELRTADVWQKTLNAVSSFISEGNFRFTDKGVAFRAMDPSQVVLVDFFMDKKVFEKYVLEPSYVGVDLVEFSKILSRAQPLDKLQLELNENELHVQLEGELSRSFHLPLIEVSEAEVNIPNARFDAHVEVNARVFKEALKDAALFGSSVVLKVKGKQLVIEARGPQGNLHIVSKEGKAVSVKDSGEVTSKYSLNFLTAIVKEADPEKQVLLDLKSDAPMRVSYSIDGCSLQFYLAHMIL